MPQRKQALSSQRRFFSDLLSFEELVLTTKNENRCSLNVHGRFALFDKHWLTAEPLQDETMLALCEDDDESSNVEPRIHFHINRTEIKWVCIKRRRLELIDHDFEIRSCLEQFAYP